MRLHEWCLVAAVEDAATTAAVAREAARVALAQGADTVIFVHVLDAHPILSALYYTNGLPVPVPLGETEDEGTALLARAEAILRAVYAARGRPAPPTRRVLATGDPAVALARIAREYNARDIVLGARRPHVLGRLFHRDVRAYLARHSTAHLHIAAPGPPLTLLAGGRSLRAGDGRYGCSSSRWRGRRTG